MKTRGKGSHIPCVGLFTVTYNCTTKCSPVADKSNLARSQIAGIDSLSQGSRFGKLNAVKYVIYSIKFKSL